MLCSEGVRGCVLCSSVRGVVWPAPLHAMGTPLMHTPCALVYSNFKIRDLITDTIPNSAKKMKVRVVSKLEVEMSKVEKI